MKKYQEAPIPADEKERLKSLKKLNILDTPPEARFDKITKLALTLFKVPISTITLVDSDREWFKSCQGLSASEGKRAISFCGHAMLAENTFIIPNALKDPRFAKNPMVIGKPFIRFYAAIPLKAADGKRIGAFCIKDYKPRRIGLENIERLKALASWAEIELNSHELSRALSAREQAELKLSELNDVLKILNKTLRHDLLNHLTVIGGNLNLMHERKKSIDDLEDLNLAIDQSINLIQQIGHLEATISSGASLKPFEVRNLVEKISRCFPMLKFNINGTGIVLTDEALYFVIENIVRNAYLHGQTKRVDIEIKRKDNIVEVNIADFGKGIPLGVRSKLFTEGFKFGSSANHGLGLYIAKRTVMRYGGNIKVSANYPKGAVFKLLLPAAI
ncbi:GAF domain-containing sensor histidine kinase [Candidatus Daviesbacteria bacterium]|nr:GAF domain-containing sensor histidine kinase [Candidatus Daviesbacteria bacterium]